MSVHHEGPPRSPSTSDLRRKCSAERSGSFPQRDLRQTALLLLASTLALLLAGCAGPQQPGGGAAEGSGSAAEEETRSRPNVVLILADDLGYGELGSYGQGKIQTPHLDRMARQGLRFTQFYSGSPVCAPSRAALLTGRHTGHLRVRGNYELGGFRDDEERGQLPLEPGTATLGPMLQEAGYTTGFVGKWGLGGPGSTGLPTRQGFDFFYGYLDQKQAHNYYPTHLWRSTDAGAVVWDTLRNDYFHPHQEIEEAPGGLAGYDPFKGADYAPDLMTEQALRFIRRNREQPFFLELAYNIPHVALQVPDEELAAYGFEEMPYLGQRGYLPHPRPRAAYAGMISRLDGYVGQVTALLDELGLDENTLVLFTSDNGPTWAGGVEPDFFGSAGGLRGLKGSVYEGGIRVPMIAQWPGRVEAGATTSHVAALWDVLPTLADLSGATPPAAIDGVSFAPTLLGREGEQREHEHLYWEHFGQCGGQQALRRGKWKAVRVGVREDPSAPVELYDLAANPDESRNVAAEHPALAEELWEAMREAHTPPTFERWEILEPEGFPGAASGDTRHPCFRWVSTRSANAQ